MLLPTLAAFAVLALAAASAGAKRWPLADAQATCRTFYADVYAATTTNVDLASVLGPPPATQQALVQSSLDQFAAGSTVAARLAAAPSTSVSGAYALFFEYCAPASGNVTGVFQTHHGLVGTAGYWNVLLDNKTDNSFAESAAAAGWATLSYDRLGVGRSAKPDGTQTVQMSFEIAQSISTATALRSGNLSDVGAFDVVVGVGHSYGSNLLAGVAGVAPAAFDALVLTGFTANATAALGPLGIAAFQSTVAAVAYPARFGGDAHDYVITPSVSADQMAFFHYPNYTQSALAQFTATKGEYTLGQQNTVASSLSLDRTRFTHPVLVLTGARDAPYCAADCLVTSLGGARTQLDTARALFPGVPESEFETAVVPDTGHGINYHETAYQAYQQIMAFVSAHV
ncbi:hypothetical protein Q5752_000373 [Cryptotrichosporon argae]